MRKMFALLLILATFTMVGCGLTKKLEEKAAEQLVEKATGLKVDEKNGTVTLQGKDGETITVTTDQGEGKLPEGFPMPVFPGAKVKSGGKITANGKNIWTVELSFNAPASQVGDFYAKFLSEKGVTDPWRMDNDDEQETSSSITGGTDTFNVIVMAYMPKEAGEEGQLSLQWQEK